MLSGRMRGERGTDKGKGRGTEKGRGRGRGSWEEAPGLKEGHSITRPASASTTLPESREK